MPTPNKGHHILRKVTENLCHNPRSLSLIERRRMLEVVYEVFERVTCHPSHGSTGRPTGRITCPISGRNFRLWSSDRYPRPKKLVGCSCRTLSCGRCGCVGEAAWLGRHASCMSGRRSSRPRRRGVEAHPMSCSSQDIGCATRCRGTSLQIRSLKNRKDHSMIDTRGPTSLLRGAS